MSAWLDFHHGTRRVSAYSAWLVSPWAAGHPVRLGYRLSGIAAIVCRRLNRYSRLDAGDEAMLMAWQFAYDRLLSFSSRKFVR